MRKFKIERPHDNVASGQLPKGMNPVGVRGRKFQEEGTVGARGHAKCVGETQKLYLSVWLEQGKWGHGGRESQEEWGWADSPGSEGHDKNFAYLLKHFLDTHCRTNAIFRAFGGY